MIATRMPPQSPDAERGVLGAVLRDNAAYDDIRSIVSAGDFCSDAHQKLFGHISELLGTGKPVDLVILRERLKAASHHEDVGGDVYLAELWDAMPTAANAEYHARIVRSTAERRRLIHLCGEIARDAFDSDEPADQLVARFESELFQVSEGTTADGPVTLAQAVQDVFTDITDLATGQGRKPIPTGFANLDQVLGGLHPERLVVVAARPSVGKSALGLSFALAAARQGNAVLVFSLEMSAREWAARTLAGTTGVPLNAILGPTALDRPTAERLVAGSEECRIPVWIDSRSEHTADTIAATARRAVRKHGVGLVVVDYLQLINHGGHRTDTLATRVGATTRKLKRLARTLRVPVVCLAQLNREVERRGDGRPQLSDLRDSGEVEQDADDVLMLWPQEVPIQRDGTLSPVQEVRICVEKQRNGPKAIVSLNYVRRYVRFEDGIPL